ncbi:hypothetical protein HW555_006919 [Spodoptera exigua]|uniref:Essential protein Yae1 N-terminal domain-containing protein n=1 Tax=Spodoptera exigua TaxID=7107 RepID=A0A835GFT5_SPOEX|nr:hypothetical protein HW555_006919 [Spodoptera exigua]
MSDYNESLSRKTRSRNLEPVAKIGYMDGASDGQTAEFQNSFNIGYEQGFTFGLQLGSNEAILSFKPEKKPQDLVDQRRINCQICTNIASAQDNVVNLFNIQQEKNTEYLLQISK